MTYGLNKLHHGVMKQTAMEDYVAVREWCIANKLPVIEPKGKYWHRVEDATAQMLLSSPNVQNVFKDYLNRGIDYYLTLFKHEQRI